MQLPHQKTLFGKQDYKEDQTICCLQENHLIDRNKHWLRVKVWEEVLPSEWPPKQAGEAILISDKVDFKLTLVKRDKEGHFVLIKEAIHTEKDNNYQFICTQCQCTQLH
jgi:hypothetical protein